MVGYEGKDRLEEEVGNSHAGGGWDGKVGRGDSEFLNRGNHDKDS